MLARHKFVAACREECGELTRAFSQTSLTPVKAAQVLTANCPLVAVEIGSYLPAHLAKLQLYPFDVNQRLRTNFAAFYSDSVV